MSVTVHVRNAAATTPGSARAEPIQSIASLGSVTAAFGRNLLVRLNRDLGAESDVEAFRHVALWNAATSNIEVYLESLRTQRVWVGAFGEAIPFISGKRIHTETCAKYDARRIDRILHGAGFSRAATFVDSASLFAVPLARVTDRG